MRNATLPNGTRVQMHAATDAWMRGDRYGTIVGRGHIRQYVDRDTREITRVRPYLVKLDKSGKTIRAHPEWIFEV